MPDDRRDVRETFDRIASHFSQTRAHPWPDVEAFLDGRTAAVGLDVGCGNGRHLDTLAQCVDRAIGLDASRALLQAAIARARTRGVPADWLQGDAVELPVQDNTVDLALYIATLHHLPDRDARIASLSDLARVLTPDAPALVTVWAVAHDRFDATQGFDTHLDWTLPNGEIVPRFYHIYDRAEFDTDLAASALAVDSIRLSAGNYYAVVRGRP